MKLHVRHLSGVNNVCTLSSLTGIYLQAACTLEQVTTSRTTSHQQQPFCFSLLYLLRPVNRSKLEYAKENSDFLRHPLMEQLVTEATNISEDAAQLMKFHGSYMQDNREKRTGGKGKFYQFMMRTKQPGGVVSNQLYLTMDDLADQVGFASSALTHIESLSQPDADLSGCGKYG